MTATTLSQLAEIVAELADRVSRATDDVASARLAARARAVWGRLQPDDLAAGAQREQTVTVEVDVPARVVCETLSNERTGAVLVVGSKGPIGVVAERDVVRAIATGASLGALVAADLIAPTLVTAPHDATVAEVASLMVRHHVRHVPLLDDGRITGVVSALDLAHALVGEVPS
jgi:CBS domain-containing protein